MENIKDTPEGLAFRCFGQEYDHLATAKHLGVVGNFDDAAGYQETADKCLDLGWTTLEDAGWRPRDVARFRQASHEQWAKQFPMTILED